MNMMQMEKKVGGGSHKDAYELNEQTIRLVPKELSASEVRGLYLLQKLAHLFLPNNIPNPLRTGTDEHRRHYIDVERVRPDAFHEYNEFRMGAVGATDPTTAANSQEIAYYRNMRRGSKMMETLRKEVGLILEMKKFGLEGLDSSPKNFSHAQGNLTYYDFKP